MTVIGAVVDGDDIEQAVVETLDTWSATYIAELERRKHRAPGTLPAPDWSILGAIDSPLTPAGVVAGTVMCAGLDGEPDRLEEGNHVATWIVAVGVRVLGAGHDDIRRDSRLYTAAVRALLIDKPPDRSWILGVEWADEAYDRGDGDLARSNDVGVVTFRVHVDGALHSLGGPVAPITDPTVDPPDVPVVETVDITLTPTTGDPSDA